MGSIKELIKSFINPAPPEKTLTELASEYGISGLKEGGISWEEFAGEDKEAKVTKRGRQSFSKAKVEQPNKQALAREKEVGEERE